MQYFFPKYGKTIEANSQAEALELLQPKKIKNVGKSKKTTRNK